MRVLGGLGAPGGPGGQRRPDRGGRTGRPPATRDRPGDRPDPVFASATAVAAVVVLVAGTLGTLWLRGWGRVGFEVPSVPWYFSFPFYVFPDPQLAPGWAAATLPVVAATVAAVLVLYRARTAWPWRVAAGMLGVPLLAALAFRVAGVVRERAWMPVDAAALTTLVAAASWGFTKGEVERIFRFLVPLVLVPVVRQLLAWRVRVPVVVGLLVGQTLLVQVLFATRW